MEWYCKIHMRNWLDNLFGVKFEEKFAKLMFFCFLFTWGCWILWIEILIRRETKLYFKFYYDSVIDWW